MTNNKGITLIALVITIIVLLILAGVSIAMLTGSNGILTQANQAKTDTANAEAAERINMELNALYSEVLEKNLSKFDTTATTGHVDKVKANLPSDYTVTPTPAQNPTKIEISGNGKKGSISITGPGVATMTPATK